MKRIYTRTEKPNEIIPIDWGNPITRGLERLYLATPSGFIELVFGKRISNPTTSGTSNIIRSEGFSRDFNGTDLEYDVLPARDRRLCTLGFAGQRGSHGSSTRYLGLSNSGDTDPLTLFGMSSGGVSNFRLFYRHDDGVAEAEAEVSRTTPFAEYVVGSLVCNDTNVSMQHGLDSPATDTIASGPCTTDILAFAGVQDASPGNYAKCSLYLVWLYNRPLRLGEIISLHRNPWQLMDGYTVILPVEVVAVAAGEPMGAYTANTQLNYRHNTF